MKKTYTKYDAVSYDVWGNVKDGFEVNDAHFFERDIEICDQISDENLKRLAKEIFSLKKYIRLGSIEIDGDPEYSLYFNYLPTGEPIGELRISDEQ